MKADVVIIGSGISGLTAGAVLSKSGKNVVIVEKQPRFGGALRQFKRQHIPFDVGFHYTGCLGEGEILDLLWKYCGIHQDIPVLPLTPGGYDHFEFRDIEKSVKGYFSYAKFAEELKQKFPAEHQAIRTYFETIQKICLEVPFYKTNIPLTPFLRGYKSRPSSLANFLNSITKDRYLQAIFSAPTFLYGVPVELASLEAHALVAHGYYSGAYGVDGGGQTIVNAFISKLKQNGVLLLNNAPVHSVRVKNGNVAGVDIEGYESIECDNVIYTGHPVHVTDIVPKSVFRPAFRHRLLDLKNSLSMFAVFGRSEHYVNTMQGPKNYYLLPGSGDVLSADETTPYHERPMMLTNTCCAQHDSLQQGQNGIILLALGYMNDVAGYINSSQNNRPQEYEEFKMSIASELVKTAEDRWGSLSGKIETLAVGTPLTFRDELAAPDGCAYGAMHCLDQFNPDVRTRLPGFYLGGQSILMTGVAGSSISALVGAGEILGLESLWESIREWN